MNDDELRQRGTGGQAAHLRKVYQARGSGAFSVSGMYRDWFLDYASYVILERAVPALYDGLKPVQRRILHAMKDLDDGRYNKVANIIGHTMQYHPHGDASIGDALVQIGTEGPADRLPRELGQHARPVIALLHRDTSKHA